MIGLATGCEERRGISEGRSITDIAYNTTTLGRKRRNQPERADSNYSDMAHPTTRVAVGLIQF